MTTLTRHPGGASVQVHARIDESFTLVYDAVVTRGGLASALPSAVAVGAAQPPTPSPSGHADVEPEAMMPRFCSDYLTQGANLGAGFAKWSPDSGETVGQRLATIVVQRHGVRTRGPAVGGATDRAGPRLADGGAHQEPRRVRLRPAADPATGGARREPVRRREADPVRDRAPRRGGATARAPEDARRPTKSPRRRPAARGASTTTLSRARRRAPSGEHRARRSDDGGHPAAPSAGRAIPPPPADPSGPAAEPGRRGAALNQQAVAEALSADVPPRDAAERVTFATWAIVTGKSPGRHLQPAAAARRRRRAAKMAQRLAERAEGPITADDVTSSRDHRGACRKGAGVFGGRRTRRVRPYHSRGHRSEGADKVPGIRLPRGRWVDRGLRAAAEAAAGGHPDVRLRARRGHHRRARGAIRAEAAARWPAMARSFWSAGRWAACWPTPARSGSRGQAPTCRSSG